MTTLREAASEFLAQKRIAVAGVSRDEKQAANLIYRRLRSTGHDVFGVNPNADRVEGDPCYPSVVDVPAELDGVVIVTTPAAAVEVARDCVDAHVSRVWLHRGIGPGSTSPEAVAYCLEHGVKVIPGGCPNMFGACSDPGHRCMRLMLAIGGKLPRTINDSASSADESSGSADRRPDAPVAAGE